MTQDEFKLFTGEAVNYTEAEWQTLVNVAKSRLAQFLCLQNLPETLPDDFKMLLANFMCAMFKFAGNGSEQVSSKSVRNFSISFTTNNARNAFSQILNEYSDIVEKYSLCNTMHVEISRGGCC